MTVTNGYATLAEIKEKERLNITDSLYDTALEGIIEAVSRAIDSECGRYFYKDTNDATRYFTAASEDYIHIGDMVSVTSVAVDLSGSRTYTTWTLDTDFDLWPYNASLDGKPYMRIECTPVTGKYFPVGIGKGVKVVGKWGWPATPKPIKEACLVWSMRMYKRYSTPLGVSAMSALGGMSLKVPPPDPDVAAMLSPYIIYAFG